MRKLIVGACAPVVVPVGASSCIAGGSGAAGAPGPAPGQSVVVRASSQRLSIIDVLPLSSQRTAMSLT
jgi:hypothetical protein